MHSSHTCKETRYPRARVHPASTEELKKRKVGRGHGSNWEEEHLLRHEFPGHKGSPYYEMVASSDYDRPLNT